MPVRIELAAMLKKREMTGRELARRIGLSETQTSLLKSGHVRGVRFDTLARICFVLECDPGDILKYTPSPSDLP